MLLGSASPTLPGRYADSLVSRVAAAVQICAEAMGLALPAEQARYRRFYNTLDGDADATPNGTGDVVALAMQAITASLPVPHALVTSFVGPALRGFGYLGEGRARASFPATLEAQLGKALTLLLSEGRARAAEAGLLVDVFRLCYPEAARLRDLSATSVAMQLGVVPTGGAAKIKVYLKTRLDTSVSHDERIAAILARLGLDDGGLYHALYAREHEAYFHGIGLDLDGDATTRLKLYIHAPLDAAMSLVDRLVHRLHALGQPADDITPAVQSLVAGFAPEHLMNELELAVALRTDGPPTFKMSLFFHRDHEPRALEEAVRNLWARHDVSFAVMDSVLEALTPMSADASTLPSPMTSAGIELPLAPWPKLNLYLQPVF
ncbi:MAG: hypothetical protein AAB426_15265 [Myxococcota bacterium]